MCSSRSLGILMSRSNSGFKLIACMETRLDERQVILINDKSPRIAGLIRGQLSWINEFQMS
jgi:hypothetical protein